MNASLPDPRLLAINALRWAVIAGGVTASVYTLVLLRAEVLFDRDTAVSVAAAVHLQPDNPDYLDRLASWQPEDAQSLLHRSVAANPFDSGAWIRLGLLSELKDADNAAAEKFYLRAAEVNHLFTPKWTLTNFYFRRQNPNQFFRWAKEALSISPHESAPVFAQMWLMSQDEGKLNETIPDRPRVLLQYAGYLTDTRRFDRVPHAVERMVRLTSKEDPSQWGRDDLLAASLDKMLAAGALTPALSTWSILASAGWLGEESVPNDRRPITNGDFHERFYGHGFDWVSLENPGTRVEQYPESPAVNISLYGDESEHLSLLQQYAPIAPGQPYLLSWHAESNDLPGPSGLTWRVHPLPDGSGPDQVSEDLLLQTGWTLLAPPRATVLLISLEYKRPPGSLLARGTIAVKSVNMISNPSNPITTEPRK